jgi:hypothetical protein
MRCEGTKDEEICISISIYPHEIGKSHHKIHNRIHLGKWRWDSVETWELGNLGTWEDISWEP